MPHNIGRRPSPATTWRDRAQAIHSEFLDILEGVSPWELPIASEYLSSLDEHNRMAKQTPTFADVMDVWPCSRAVSHGRGDHVQFIDNPEQGGKKVARVGRGQAGTKMVPSPDATTPGPGLRTEPQHAPRSPVTTAGPAHAHKNPVRSSPARGHAGATEAQQAKKALGRIPCSCRACKAGQVHSAPRLRQATPDEMTANL